MITRCFGVFVVLFAVAAGAQEEAAPQPQTLQVDPAQSKVHMHVVHKFHKVNGTSQRVEGKARRLPNDRVQVDLRVPAESFTTGNVQRDSAMRESIQAAQFPEVELKAVGEVPWPTEFPSETEETFNAQLDLHGQKQELKVPVKLKFQDAAHLSAHASFQVSLESFGIKRPSLMFVKVNDPLTIDADVAFVPGG